MGRPIEGWHLRKRGKIHFVYFTHQGRLVQRTTRRPDPEGAAKVAADIYAAVTTGREPTRTSDQPRTSTEGTKLQQVGQRWLNSVRGRLDERTVKTYGLVIESHLVRFFETLEAVTAESIEDYTGHRLARVRSQTVKHELSVLRQILAFATKKGVTGLPTVPRFNTRELGRGTASTSKHGVPVGRSSAPAISPAEVEDIISRLPERSPRGWPIRARFVVGYETSLRPTLLDLLSVPEHYTKGSESLRIPQDDDKIGFGRTVPLSRRARQALDAVLPKEGGIIFGKHDYRYHIDKAAKAVLGEGPRYQAFNGSHTRSARITHDLESTGNIPGVQWNAGHKLMATTAGYVKPSERAAKAVLKSRGAL